MEYVTGKRNNGSCLHVCLDNNIHSVAAFEDTQAGSGKYSETPKVRGVRPLNVYKHVTFYRVHYRCPIHYSCDEQPCQNGSTCEIVKHDGQQFGSTKNGSICHCADGYKGWFCKEMYTCSDNMCHNQANCSMPNGTEGLIHCECGTDHKGFYCEEKIVNTVVDGYTKQTKTVIAIVATTVLALAGMATVAMALGGAAFAGAAATGAAG